MPQKRIDLIRFPPHILVNRSPHEHTTTHIPQRRWAILAVLALAQLMVVLDTTIINVALPSAQEAIGFSDHDRK